MIEKLEFQMFVMDELAEKLASNGQDVIKLTLGKSPEELNPKIIEKYHQAIDDIAKRSVVYPQGLPALREAIAMWYSSMGNNVSTKSVIINTGTSPFFKDLMRLLIEGNEDEILMPYPYYSVYYVSAILAGAKVKFYDINQDTLSFNLESFKKNYSSTKTKLVILCSPGNPYGNILSSQDFKDILATLDKDTYVLSDEIYRNMSFGDDTPSILDVAEDNSRIIVSNSFSKGFRMYTSRVGFVILPKKLMKYFRVLLQHTLLTTNPVEQYAALEAINNLNDLDELRKLYSARNDYIFNKFQSIESVSVIKAKGGFYCVLDCRGYMKSSDQMNSSNLAKDILNKTGVAVVPGVDFGIDNCLRVSFTSDRFNEAVDRLANYFYNK